MSIDDIITLVIVGAVAGWLGRQVVKGFKTGLIGTIFVGVLGAFLGTYIVQWTGIIINFGNDLATSIATAFLGAVVVLVVMRILH